MMPISRRALIVALALFALACVIRAPLGLLTLFLPQRIQLKNVEGSIWNGRASAVGVGGIIIQQDVEWHFRPQSVLSASLAWGISGRFAEKASQLTFELRPGGSGLSQVSVFIPLEPLAALHPQLKAAQVGALLHVMSSHLSPHAPAKASVDVDQLFSSLIPQAGQLGRYQVDFDVAADGRGRWTLTSLPGALAATGQGQIDASQAVINGQLTLTPAVPLPGLTPVLSALPKEGNGFRIAF